MTQYKKGDVILVTCKDIDRVAHITLLKLLKGPDRNADWTNYMLIQINHHDTTMQWPKRLSDVRFSPNLPTIKLTTDIKSTMNFKKDYVKAVFESGYIFKG